MGLAASNGAPLLMVQFPALLADDSQHHDHPMMQRERWLRETIDTLGLATIDARAVFETQLGAADAARWRSKDNDHIHPGKEAQHAIAQVLGAELARQRDL
jgi:hypothetical protein